MINHEEELTSRLRKAVTFGKLLKKENDELRRQLAQPHYGLAEQLAWPDLPDNPEVRQIIPVWPTAILPVIALRAAMLGIGAEFKNDDMVLWNATAKGKAHMCSCAQPHVPYSGADQITRRKRELQQVRGWSIETEGHRYVLVKVGDYIWHPGYREVKGSASDIRQQVFSRDRHVCQECGLREGEMRPDGTKVKLQVGRILPGALGGAYTVKNCRAECSQCNGPKRDAYFPRIEDYFPG